MEARGLGSIWAVTAVVASSIVTQVAAVASAQEVKPQQQEQDAGGTDWSAAVDLTYNSKYVWRGIDVVDDPVVQPSVTVTWKGLSLNLWGNLDLTGVNGNAGNLTEVDSTLAYSGSAGALSYGVGFISYAFPHTGAAATAEIFGSLGLDVPSAPTLTLYRDIDQVDGVYAALAVGHIFEGVADLSTSASMGVAVSGSIGWGDGAYNDGYFGVDRSKPNDLTLGIAFPIAIGDRFVVTPGGHYSNLLDSSIARAAGHDPSWWVGVSATLSL